LCQLQLQLPQIAARLVACSTFINFLMQRRQSSPPQCLTAALLQVVALVRHFQLAALLEIQPNGVGRAEGSKERE